MKHTRDVLALAALGHSFGISAQRPSMGVARSTSSVGVARRQASGARVSAWPASGGGANDIQQHTNEAMASRFGARGQRLDRKHQENSGMNAFSRATAAYASDWQGIPPYLEYGKRIESTQSLDVLSEDVLVNRPASTTARRSESTSLY